MEIRSIANNVRVSPQKVRLVVTQIKKMRPADALTTLEFVPQKAGGPLKKAIMSAIANAKNNFNLDESTLMFSEISVGKGISFKRFRAISRGRAHSILKQTSNIRIILKGEKAQKITPTQSAKASTETLQAGTKKTENANQPTKEAKNGTKS